MFFHAFEERQQFANKKKSVFFPLIFTISYIFSGIHKLLDLLQ